MKIKLKIKKDKDKYCTKFGDWNLEKNLLRFVLCKVLCRKKISCKLTKMIKNNLETKTASAKLKHIFIFYPLCIIKAHCLNYYVFFR